MTTAEELADEILRRLSTSQNSPMRNEPLRYTYQAKRPPPPSMRPWSWCTIEKKWTNHEAHECYFWLRNEGNMQRILGLGQPYQQGPYRPMGNSRMKMQVPMERPQLVLGQQPPLPWTGQLIKFC